MVTRALLAAAVCAGLALAGCSGDRDTGEGRKVEAAVKRFALSDGADACGMLSSKAVTALYGGGSLDPAAGRSGCVAKSSKFEGQAIDVTFVRVNTDTGAHATAKTLDGRRYYSVALIKLGGRWLIDSIAQKQRPD